MNVQASERDCDVPKHSVPVYTGMLKVDTCRTVCSDDDLQLVIPPVRASTNLNSIFEVVSAAEEVVAQLGEVVRVGIVKAYDEKGFVNNFKAGLVVPVLGERLAKG